MPRSRMEGTAMTDNWPDEGAAGARRRTVNDLLERCAGAA